MFMMRRTFWRYDKDSHKFTQVDMKDLERGDIFKAKDGDDDVVTSCGTILIADSNAVTDGNGVLSIDANTSIYDKEHIARTCEYFSCQRDRNEEIAICYCSLLGAEPDKDHEGNCGQYPCPKDKYLKIDNMTLRDKFDI